LSSSKIRNQNQNILLAYLVLPLALHEESKQSLVGAKTTSSIHTFSKKKEIFFGLQDRVQAYKALTNKSIQYAIDNQIDKDKWKANCWSLVKENKVSKNLKDSLKASSNLYKILKN